MTTASELRRLCARAPWLTLATLVCATPEFASGVEAEPPEELGRVATALEPKGSKRVTLGVGLAARPHFEGSDGYQGEPVPLIDVQWGKFFARSGEGIGFDVIDTKTFRAGAALNWMKGYKQDEAPRGLEEVKDAFGARLFASVRLNGTVATFAGTRAITERERGLILNVSLAHPVVLSSRLVIVPSLAATWADADYMVSYFGVTPAEAAVSGFNPYQPGSGVKDLSFRLAANFRLTSRLSIVTFVGVTRLLNVAADSPFVEHQTQPLGLAGLTYRFK